jgi:hypothetical protein
MRNLVWLMACWVVLVAARDPCDKRGAGPDGFALGVVDSIRFWGGNAIYEVTVYDADTSALLGSQEFWSPYNRPVLDPSVKGEAPGLTPEGMWVSSNVIVHMPKWSFSTVGLIPDMVVLIIYKIADEDRLTILKAYPVGRKTTEKLFRLEEKLAEVDSVVAYVRQGYRPSWDHELQIMGEIKDGSMLDRWLTHGEEGRRWIRALLCCTPQGGPTWGEFKRRWREREQ